MAVRVPQDERDAVRNARRDYQIERAFLARQTGTVYQRESDNFACRVQQLPDPIAETISDRGAMPFPVAQDDTHAHLRFLAKQPPVDSGRRMADAVLQRFAIARVSMPSTADPLCLIGVTIALADHALAEL